LLLSVSESLSEEDEEPDDEADDAAEWLPRDLDEEAARGRA